MDMVERVRAALVAELSKDATNCVSDYRAEGGDDELFIDGNFNGSALARAVIAAMREPTPRMIYQGNEGIDDDIESWNYESDQGYQVGASAALNCWQRMIDAALTSSEPPK